MDEAKIIDRGRGPELAGTRITVYDVLDYHELGWHREMIADTLELSSQQVEVALRYIAEHRDEVMADYAEMLACDARGNAPELSDALIWATCQREELVLITGNRNKRGPDSLQAVLDRENRTDSLPVITIADARP